MQRRRKTFFLALVLAGCTHWGDAPAAVPGTVYELERHSFKVETVASGLYVPWSLAWTPQGRLLITQRDGRLMVVEKGADNARPLADVPGVDHGGEHGLMGMALSPTFADDQLIYFALTARKEGRLVNRIVRFKLAGAALNEAAVLVDDLPASDYHDGLPLRFGGDGKLYASTGDSTHRQLAQRKDSLAGKFLRINADGSVPADNPFAPSPIWTLGHRNCQGFDWQPSSGILIATEHGPSLGMEPWGGGDELNWIVKGRNYGWPIIHNSYEGSDRGLTPPLKYWGDPAIAPAGGCFYDGDKFPRWRDKFFFSTLRGERIFCVTLKVSRDTGGKVSDVRVERVSEALHKEFGRLRAMAQGPDDCLYITTSNRDKRGEGAPNDDRVLRLVPQ